MSAERDRAELVAIDRRHVWRPYTSSEDHEGRDPIVVARAEGPWLEDADGRRILDGSGAWWCNNLGHGHPRLRQALSRQAADFMHVSLAGTTHEPAARLAAELAAVAPKGLERVFFTDCGSAAVEVAVKIAFQYWQQNGRPERQRVLTLPGAYHGDTFGAMSLSAVSEFSAVFEPLLFQSERGEGPDLDAAVDQLCELVEVGGETIAAVVVEPLLQGASGMRRWSADRLRRLRDVTRAVDTFLICDEVFTGFGRTGPMWACDHADVSPDLLCTAKGLTGGMLPLAATLATSRVFDGFRGDKRRALMHGHTFCGNALAAAIAREVLAIYRDEDILGGVPERAALLDATAGRLGALAGVRSARSFGMVAAADLGAAEGYHGDLGWLVHDAALRRGAQLRPLGNTVYTVVPLNIPIAALEELLAIVEASVQEVLAARVPVLQRGQP